MCIFDSGSRVSGRIEDVFDADIAILTSVSLKNSGIAT